MRCRDINHFMEKLNVSVLVTAEHIKLTGNTCETVERIEHTIPEGFIEIQQFRSEFRRVYIQQMLYIAVTYCEGDITVEFFDTAPEFAVHITNMRDFYRRFE